MVVITILVETITSLERMAASRRKKCNDQAKKPFDSPVPLLYLRHTMATLRGTM
jgi:hypothetical protein